MNSHDIYRESDNFLGLSKPSLSKRMYWKFLRLLTFLKLRKPTWAKLLKNSRPGPPVLVYHKDVGYIRVNTTIKK